MAKDAADFVRGLSAELTLREMDEALKKAGHSIGHARVYQIRSQEKLGFKRVAPGTRFEKKKVKAKKKVAKVTAREAIAAIPKPKPPLDVKGQVRKLAMRISLPKLAELVRELEREIE